jgi:hypothetical protein
MDSHEPIVGARVAGDLLFLDTRTRVHVFRLDPRCELPLRSTPAIDALAGDLRASRGGAIVVSIAALVAIATAIALALR